MSIALGLLAVLLLTLATGFFVAQEFAFVAADRTMLRERAETDPAAARAVEVTGRLSFMLSGAQLGITITTLLVGFIAQPAIADVLRAPLADLGLPPGAVPGVSVAVGVAIATIVQMIIGELAPKNLGIARPEQVAVALSRSTLIYLKVAGPLIRLFDSAATRLVRLAGIEPVEELEHGATPEELSRIVAESSAAGELPPRLAELLERALEFGDRTAWDVMVPRPRVVLLRAQRPASDLLDAVREHGHSRYPVVDDGGDDVVGTAGLLEYLASPADATIGDITRAPLLVPDTLPVTELLKRMEGDTFACVIDEYGGLAGIVTMEDLAEELVGELVDENDPEPLGVVVNTDGTWDVPGTLRIDEVERATGVELPEGDGYETIGGLVLSGLGRMAEQGDSVTVATTPETHLLEEETPPPQALLTVLKVHRRVPEWVRLSLGVPAPAESPENPPVTGSGLDYAPELFSALFQGRPA
ncbi:membrane protein [Acrocarpospora corrugata]|uniref:Membrane protein n=1 Tax=Acrocarpospora corrugata TaxID=35763 RepID=A0A5M3WFM8_9ACTN|nr:hemolysin family protein [Acrocarpospora corrugata]GES05188.1 membrane protein [Acrocarpospora corrugata]